MPKILNAGKLDHYDWAQSWEATFSLNDTDLSVSLTDYIHTSKSSNARNHSKEMELSQADRWTATDWHSILLTQSSYSSPMQFLGVTLDLTQARSQYQPVACIQLSPSGRQESLAALTRANPYQLPSGPERTALGTFN